MSWMCASRVIAPLLLLSHTTRCRLLRAPADLHPWKVPLVPTKWEAGWTPRAGMVTPKKNIINSTGNEPRFLGCLTPSLVATPSMLCQPQRQSKNLLKYALDITSKWTLTYVHLFQHSTSRPWTRTVYPTTMTRRSTEPATTHSRWDPWKITRSILY